VSRISEKSEAGTSAEDSVCPVSAPNLNCEHSSKDVVHSKFQALPESQLQVIKVRLAYAEDWPSLHALWQQHHHLREAVSSTSRSLLFGPPAWMIFVAIACRVQDSLKEKWAIHTLCLQVFLGYAGLWAGQHLLHWLCARLILEYDLRWGELTAASWGLSAGSEPGRTQTPVIVAEVDRSESREIVGVVCVKLKPVWNGCGPCSRRAQHPSVHGPVENTRRPPDAVASLWHAAVYPGFRNQGVAAALLTAAERWAKEKGATSIETVCLSMEAKAACWNAGFELWNSWTGRLPLVPATFFKKIASE